MGKSAYSRLRRLLKMKKKKFDCVEMMHEGARRIYEETRGMSREEELEYWRKETERLFPDRFPAKPKSVKRPASRQAAR